MRGFGFLLLGLLLGAAPAVAQDRGTVQTYDSAGRLTGRQDTSGGPTRFYDSTGRAETRDGTTRFYDSAGRATGRAETRGDTTRFYDPAGRRTGEARRR